MTSAALACSMGAWKVQGASRREATLAMSFWLRLLRGVMRRPMQQMVVPPLLMEHSHIYQNELQVALTTEPGARAHQTELQVHEPSTNSQTKRLKRSEGSSSKGDQRKPQLDGPSKVCVRCSNHTFLKMKNGTFQT